MKVLGIRNSRISDRKQVTRNKEQGTSDKNKKQKQGASNKEQKTGSKEQESRSNFNRLSCSLFLVTCSFPPIAVSAISEHTFSCRGEF
jgi:hypothetical protein